MSSQAVRRSLTSRVRALARELPGAVQDDLEALHRARVASRRVREILPVLSKTDEGDPTPKALRRRVRQVTRALGGVRELDVALLILDELSARHPELGSFIDAVRSRVRDERRGRREGMTARLQESAGLRLPDDLGILSGTAGSGARSDLRRRLARRLRRRADRLESAIDEAGSLFVSERLHAVRIAAKQLRYALELVHEFGGAGTKQLTTTLKQYQDLLGRLHDLEIVSGYARREAWNAEGQAGVAAARFQELIDREIRELHAAYLADLVVLRDVVASCRSRVLPRLTSAGESRRRAGGSQ